jgi:hypothetical protein
MASAMNPSNEFPHPSPSRPYIAGPASGRKQPQVDRSTVLAATTEAECIVYASMRYVIIGICEGKLLANYEPGSCQAEL